MLGSAWGKEGPHPIQSNSIFYLGALVHNRKIGKAFLGSLLRCYLVLVCCRRSEPFYAEHQRLFQIYNGSSVGQLTGPGIGDQES